MKYAAAIARRGFEQLPAPISGKTSVAASDVDLQREVAGVLDSLGTPKKQPGAARYLGVDAGLGRGLSRPTHAARTAKANVRIDKLKDFAKTDANGGGQGLRSRRQLPAGAGPPSARHRPDRGAAGKGR